MEAERVWSIAQLPFGTLRRQRRGASHLCHPGAEAVMSNSRSTATTPSRSAASPPHENVATSLFRGAMPSHRSAAPSQLRGSASSPNHRPPSLRFLRVLGLRAAVLQVLRRHPALP
jgi:hypothetical protein